MIQNSKKQHEYYFRADQGVQNIDFNEYSLRDHYFLL